MTYNWRNIELADQEEKENLCNFLRSLDIYFEVSGCFDWWHIEIKVTEEEEKAVNAYIDNGFLPPVYEVLGYYGKNYSGLADSFTTWSEDMARDKVWEFSTYGYYCELCSPDGKEYFTPDEVLDECKAYCEEIGEEFTDPREDRTGTPNIIQCDWCNTGGGIYVFIGTFEDGTYFLLDGDMFDVRILDIYPDWDNEDIWHEEEQQKHLVRDLDTETQGPGFVLKVFKFLRDSGDEYIDSVKWIEEKARELDGKMRWR